MLELVPLDLLDNFLLDYHAGHALLAGFVLSVLGLLPLKSGKLLSLNVIIFGLLFLLIPTALASVEFKLFGLVLLVIGPVLYTVSRE